MNGFDQLIANLLSPVTLAFGLGLLATWLRSDLKIPDEVFTALSVYLLLAIGLKGGAALAASGLRALVAPGLVTLTLGAVTPLIAFALARLLIGVEVVDAAALAAHYGSVSAVTFLASLDFLDRSHVPYDGYVVALVALLEVPAILVALTLARSSLRSAHGLLASLREVAVSKSVFLLLGGMALGFLGGERGLARVAPFFVEPFQGVLLLFLLELGLVTARRLPEVRRLGLRPLFFGLLLPPLHALLALLLARLAGMGVGSATVLAVLASSASYIAAPAAVRLALPQANPSLYLGLSLGVTFPFNLVVGIPVYRALAERIVA